MSKDDHSSSSLSSNLGTNVDDSCGNEPAIEDPDRFEKCPYDPNHQIRTSRFREHLIKCRKNHPELALEACPYNATHLMPRNKLKHHKLTCPNKPVNTNNKSPHHASPTAWQQALANSPKSKAPTPEEDWDKECDESATPFVLSPSATRKPRLTLD